MDLAITWIIVPVSSANRPLLAVMLASLMAHRALIARLVFILMGQHVPCAKNQLTLVLNVMPLIAA